MSKVTACSGEFTAIVHVTEPDRVRPVLLHVQEKGELQRASQETKCEEEEDASCGCHSGQFLPQNSLTE